MSTERLYLSDPFLFEFTANIVRKMDLADGAKACLLDRTAFYPTGGGQEHDTGSLGGAPVKDVYTDDDGNIIHVLDRDILGATVTGRVDAARRLGFMQHHSAQHLISAVVDRLFGLETISSHISIDSPTTIDVPGTMTDADSIRVEDEANSIIREDREIRSFLVADEGISSIPFRRPPKVSGEIRVVEITGVDYCACGGTHCTRTGMIGVVKVLRVEHRGEKLRLYFVAGERAVSHYRLIFNIVSTAAHRLDTNPDGILERLDKQTEELRNAQEELERLREEKQGWEVHDLVLAGVELGSIRLVQKVYQDRLPNQVRGLARLLQEERGIVAMLAAFDGARLTLTVSCGPDMGIKANELLRLVFAGVSGRGGGDARLAQGGAAVTQAQLETILDLAREHVRSMASGAPSTA